MARRSVSAVMPWQRRALTIPPKSLNDWLRLAARGVWMGSLVCALLWAGGALVATAPDRINLVYRTGAMNAAFSALSGLFMIGAAIWLLWELWDAVAPPPITDDFLRLLSYSFARQWRDPRTWPWARLAWAYGFAVIGAAVSASIGLVFWWIR